jgi:hypothetical protein
MFLTTEELKSVLYEYQLSEITESDADIPVMAINAAVEEVTSYLSPTDQIKWRDGRPRYDVAAIFSATGAARNAMILSLVKSIALYQICQLANVDIIQERVIQRYDRAIEYLEKVAGIGKYKDSAPIAPNFPVLPAGDEETAKKAFRFGSREKFNHEI